jgi:hypothetical protein
MAETALRDPLNLIRLIPAKGSKRLSLLHMIALLVVRNKPLFLNLINLFVFMIHRAFIPILSTP